MITTFNQLCALSLLERLSFNDLLRVSEPKRLVRSNSVTGPPLRVDAYRNTMYYAFNFKAHPSTTGLRHKGYIKFFRPNRPTPMGNVECLVDCDCFGEDTLVLMGDGTYRPIVQIRPGDVVYTHLGRIRPVTHLVCRPIREDERVHEIKLAGFPKPVIATGNHPFYILRQNSVCRCGCGGQLSSRNSQPDQLLRHSFLTGHHRKGQALPDEPKFQWIQVDDFRSREWFLSPWLEEGLVTPSYSLEFARLVGYYAAEGCLLHWNTFQDRGTQGRHVRLTFNINELDTLGADIAQICQHLGYEFKIKKHVRQAFDLTIVSPELYAFCLDNVGVGSHYKRLSSQLMSWSNDLLRELYIGLQLGDGNINSTNLRYASSSFDLISQVSTILSRLHVRNLMANGKEKVNFPGDHLHCLSIPTGESAERVYAWLRSYLREKDQGITFQEQRLDYSQDEGQLRSFGRGKRPKVIDRTGMVYCLIVEEDHSFIAHGVAVQNCHDYRFRWAWTNKQRGSGKVGPDSVNQAWNQAPRITNPAGRPGLCFSGDTLVLVGDGTYKPISTLHEGDLVYTHRGRLRRVLGVVPRPLKNDETAHEIRVLGFPLPLVASDIHPFLALRGNTICCCGCGKEFSKTEPSHQRVMARQALKEHRQRPLVVPASSMFQWVEVKNFRKYEWFLAPWLENVGQAHVDPDLARLLGYYVAEGCAAQDKWGVPIVKLTFNVDELETLGADVLRICEKLGYKAKLYRCKTKAIDIKIINLEFWKLCRDHVGRGSHDKRLSSWVMSWDKASLKELYVGAQLGDGYLGVQGYIKYGSASFHLVSQMSTILGQLGVRHFISKMGKKKRDPNEHHHGTLIPRSDSAKVFEWLRPYLRVKNLAGRDREETRSSHIFPEGCLRALKWNKAISFDGLMWDLTVEEDESFIVHGVAVHNCKHLLALRNFIKGQISDKEFIGQGRDDGTVMRQLVDKSKELWIDIEGAMSQARERERRYAVGRLARNRGEPPPDAPLGSPTPADAPPPGEPETTEEEPLPTEEMPPDIELTPEETAELEAPSSAPPTPPQLPRRRRRPTRGEEPPPLPLESVDRIDAMNKIIPETKVLLLEELDDLEQSLGPDVGDAAGVRAETPETGDAGEAGKTEGQQALSILGEIRDLIKQALAPEDKEPEDAKDDEFDLEAPPEEEEEEEEEYGSVDKLKGV